MTAKQADAKDLIDAGYSRSSAARVLGITPRGLKKRLRRANVAPLPVGRPAKPKLRRISYAATRLI